MCRTLNSFVTYRWHPWRCFRSSSTPVSSPETRPLSSLQSLCIILTNVISNLTGSPSLNPFSPPAVSPVRYDLDACDIQEKYPDLFQVNLNIEVDSRDKPRTKSPPWEGFQTKGLNPKVLFSSRDEQQEILSKFGTQRFCNKAILLVCCLQPSFISLWIFVSCLRAVNSSTIHNLSGLQGSLSCLVSRDRQRFMTPILPSQHRPQKVPVQLNQSLLGA